MLANDIPNFVMGQVYISLLEELCYFTLCCLSNGGGQILFSEFVDWALEKNLDLEDDIDED